MRKRILSIIGVVLFFLSLYQILNILNQIRFEKNYYTTITTEQFKKNINNKEFVVYFYKKDCNACALLKKDINGIVEKYKIDVYAVDIMNTDNNEIIYDYADIEYTPTIIRFINGKEKERLEGNNGYKKTYNFLIK